MMAGTRRKYPPPRALTDQEQRTVCEHLGIVRYHANRLARRRTGTSRGPWFEDAYERLASAGYEGLCVGVQRHDGRPSPTVQSRATAWVVAAMLRELYRDDLVRVPEHHQYNDKHRIYPFKDDAQRAKAVGPLAGDEPARDRGDDGFADRALCILESMPPEFRQVYQYRLEGMTKREAAERAGIHWMGQLERLEAEARRRMHGELHDAI